MGKLLLLLSFLSLLTLILGVTFLPNNQIFIMASGSVYYKYVCEVLAGILFIQLITHPPRHLVFRVLSGMIALGIGTWVIVEAYYGIMPFLDTFSLLASAAAIGITALEVQQPKKTTRPDRTTNPLIA
jgi:hypothetical protein